MKMSRSIWRLSVGVLLTAGAGVVLGLFVYGAASHAELERAMTRFERISERRAAALQDRFNDAQRTVEAAGAVVATFPALTYRQFVTFARHLEAEHSDLKALEWAPRVDREVLGLHEREAQRQGFEKYRIMELTGSGALAPAGDRAVYYPVRFIEPLAGNERALGLDLGSEAKRRAALVKAARTGRPAASSPLRLVQETGDSLSFLLVAPVTRGSSRVAGQTGVDGFVVGVFRIGDLLKASMLEAESDRPYVSLKLADTDPRGGFAVSYSAGGFTELTSNTWVPASHEVHLAERRLWLLARPSKAYLAGERTTQPIALGLATFLLFGMLIGLAVLARRAAKEKSRRQDTELVRSVIHSIPDGVVVADSTGRFVVANEAARRIAGVTAGHVPPDEWSRVFGLRLPGTDGLCPPEQLPLRRAMHGEEVRGVELVVDAAEDGRERFVNVTGAPLRDRRGNVQGGVAVFQDITERREVEMLSRQLSNAVEQTADSVVITDRQGTIVYVNRAFEETTGFSREEALGRTPRILNSGHHDQAFYENLWREILDGRPFRGTILNRKKSGETYWAQQTISPVKAHNGTITHFVSVLKDVTDLIERQKQEFHLQIAREVQQRYYNVAASVPGFDIAGAARPQDLTGGDYFDFIPVDDGLYVATGDVAGHGFGSALVMAQLRASVRSAVDLDLQPHEVLTRVNRTLKPDIGENRFATLILARLDAVQRVLEYASAGHIRCYLLDRTGSTRQVLKSTGKPLGLIADAAFLAGHRIALESGDILVLLTDGITEAPNQAGEQFGEQRALDYVAAHRGESAEQILTGLFEEVCRFCDHHPQVDDITGVICKVLSEGLPAADAAAQLPPPG
jgi:PAS domain S-box-containing protein